MGQRGKGASQGSFSFKELWLPPEKEIAKQALQHQAGSQVSQDVILIPSSDCPGDRVVRLVFCKDQFDYVGGKT